MGWKLFAILRLLATPLSFYDAPGWDEFNVQFIAECLLSLTATLVVCLYAFDGKLLPKPIRLLIAISLSILLAHRAFFYIQVLYWLPRYELILTDFAIPMITGVLCVLAAWRYSIGRTVGAVRV